MTMRYLIPVAAAIVAATLAACGDDSDPAPAPTRTSGAAATSAAGGQAASTSMPALENPTVTPSGLKFQDLAVGTGASPSATQQVTVHYTGWLAANGTKFDSSRDRGQPATFAMNGVIKGFSEGLATMKVGGRRVIYVPAALGYGARANGPIPANSDLIFELELLGVR
jgi:peptidylprolyl isomerase